MNNDLLLALDQGGHASRALVFDTQGRQLAQAYAAIGTQREGSDRVQHHAVELLESLRTVIDDVMFNLGRDARRIRVAGLATQRSSIVCWDAHSGEPLSPVLSWQDRRNAALVAQLEPRRADIQRLTGLVLSPHYGASKLRWCLDELPEVQRAHREQRLCCGPLASYLLQGLVPQQAPRLHVVDPANASRTQLWSPTTGDWCDELLAAFGVPREVLPRCVPTRFEYGALQVAQHRIPLAVCTGDQAAVPFAQGALDPGTIYLNLGTGAFALQPLEQDVSDAAPLLRSVLWSDAQHVRYALEGTVNGAGSALQWLSERSGLDVMRAAQALTRAHRDSVVPLFINAVGGIGSPYWLSALAPHFVAETTATDTAQVVAVLESIAFLIADNIALMRNRAGPSRAIVAGGGLAACNYLCEAIAALTDTPLIRLSATELTGKGLAFLASGQPDAWPQDANVTRFAPGDDPPLQARYAQWREHMARHAGGG